MRQYAERHPNLATWLVLAVGMVAVLGWSARDVGLTATQYFWLVVATVLLAGLCAWIISLEADEECDEGEMDEDAEPGVDDRPVAAPAPDAAASAGVGDAPGEGEAASAGDPERRE